MDIKSGAGYPASALSNFSPHPFVFDGVEINSMEGFLQSLKFPYPEIQVEVCKLVGFAAMKRGRQRDWKKDQTLYWKGVPIKRKSLEYQELLTRAYDALFENASFQKALKATGTANIDHSIGKKDQSDTVLTRREFCSQLHRLRDKL